MRRIVINLDDEWLEKVSKLFGTRTKAATVHAALTEAVDRAERAELIDWLAASALPAFGDPEVMEAWRWEVPHRQECSCENC